MTGRYRIVDRPRFFRVLRKFFKYISVPTILIAVFLTVFLSYVAIDHNSGGYYCDYYDSEGAIYRERQGCSVRIARVAEYFIETMGIIFLLVSPFFLILGGMFYTLYFVFSPQRLGFNDRFGPERRRP